MKPGAGEVSWLDRNSAGRPPSLPGLLSLGSNSLWQALDPSRDTLPIETKPLSPPSNQLNGRDIGQRVGATGSISDIRRQASQIQGFEIRRPPSLAARNAAGHGGGLTVCGYVKLELTAEPKARIQT